MLNTLLTNCKKQGVNQHKYGVAHHDGETMGLNNQPRDSMHINIYILGIYIIQFMYVNIYTYIYIHMYIHIQWIKSSFSHRFRHSHGIVTPGRVHQSANTSRARARGRWRTKGGSLWPRSTGRMR